MKTLSRILIAAGLVGLPCADVAARGFGGYRGGGGGGRSYGGGGGDRYGGFSGGYSHERSGGYGGSSSSSRSVSGYSGWHGGGGASSSYDHSYTTNRGGSINTEGSRGAAEGPRGGMVAGGSRETTATTAGGKTYSGSREGGAAVGPNGRAVGGASYAGTASGARGTVSGGWQSAFAGRTFPSDFGHAGAVGAAGYHSTAYWSHGYTSTHAGYVRSGFGYYNCFHPAWYSAHPGCWAAAGWAAGAAWATPAWPAVAAVCAPAATPVDYDFGNTVIYNDNSVYENGQDMGTAQAYSDQATAIAGKGQTAPASPDQPWTALGVFALVQGDEKTSNNIFQLAVNKDGIIRGNYYDGIMDTATDVFGSVDQKTQRAAWTIGKKKDRVFEAGIYNLTKDETPVLIHLGPDKTQQWLLVRVPNPNAAKGN